MIKAISGLYNNLNSKNVSFSKNKSVSSSMQSNAAELPCAKKMNNLSKDTFKKISGPVCGIDLSFEDA